MAVYSPAMTFFKRDRKMDNHFENKDGEQNIAQGENPIAKQVNNYFRQPLKPRFLIIAALLAAGVIRIVVVAYDRLVLNPTPSVTTTTYRSGPESPTINAQTVTISYGVPQKQYDEIKRKLDEYDLLLIARYAEALDLCEQNLSIKREIDKRKGEAKLLNDISQIYRDKGDYGKALQYLEQSLKTSREISGKESKAEPYLSRAVELGTQLEGPDIEERRKALEAVRPKLREQQ